MRNYSRSIFIGIKFYNKINVQSSLQFFEYGHLNLFNVIDYWITVNLVLQIKCDLFKFTYRYNKKYVLGQIQLGPYRNIEENNWADPENFR